MKTKFLYLKIIFVFLIAFLCSSTLINEVFVAYTPKIRYNLGEYLAQRINGLVKKEQIDQSVKTASVEVLKQSLKPVAKGIKAASIGSSSYIEYNLKEVEWIEKEFSLPSGKKITVQFPKGMPEPSIEYLETIAE